MESMVFETGKLYYSGLEISCAGLEWNAHPSFNGVYLKHLIKGSETDNRFSAHLVKIDGHCMIGNHIHKEQFELHEVISGRGKCSIKDKKIDYYPGVMALIPVDTDHKVHAAGDGIILMAKFTPALL